MNYRKVFKYRQKDLIYLANTKVGRFLLGANIDAPIIGITPNTIIYDWKPKLRGEFFSGNNRNVQILLPLLTQLDIVSKELPKYVPTNNKEYIEIVEHLSGVSVKSSLPFVFLDTGSFEAASGGTGGVLKTDATYSTARSATTAGSSNPGVGNDGVGGAFEITRWFCPTDFSSIPAGSDVTASTGAIWPATRNSTVDDTLQFILTTQASTSAVDNDDYDNITLNSPTVYGTSGAYSTLNLNEYNNVTMDAGFFTLLESAVPGFVKMGARASGDISNTSPTTNRSFLTMSTTNAERTKFDVTWTPPSTVVAGGYSFFM